MSGLSLSLLGTYSAALDGKPVGGFRTRPAQALLIYLACEPERHRREHLMAMLWPGMPQASAQQNLRQNLYLLRKVVPEVEANDGQGSVPFVLAHNETLQLNPGAAVAVDARRFAALLDRIRPGLNELEETVNLYRGDFLAEFYLPDSNPFEEWAAARREAYRRGVLLALGQLTDLYLGDQDYVAAESAARRQMAIDPLHEMGNRQLIEALARRGHRSAALAHFDDYRRLLHVELGVNPGSETLVLISAVREGELLTVVQEPDHIRGYAIHEELGRGSYGVVYRASQSLIGRDVAIKVIPARYADDVVFIRRFEAEARTIATLEHPWIVPLYDYWREPGAAYLVMRYLRGGNLKTALAGGSWDPVRVAQLLNQLAAALAIAHRHGVVHRDVKPANVLLDEDSNAYLTDFGIAKLVRPEGSPTTITSAEIFAGTPEYVSPEHVRDEEVTPLSDQYSLGLVIYEALSGQPPFAAGSLLELLEMHAGTPLPSLRQMVPDIPAAVDEVLARATAKQPQDRFEDVSAFARAFCAAIQADSIVAPIIETLPDVGNPYKGLLAFTESDAELFYGRETSTKQLIDRLAETHEYGRFLAVVGPSGSGKSSLVKAGLVPALRGGELPGSNQWFILDMIPGTHPYEELETALLRVAVNPPASLLDQLQDGERGILRAVRRILPPDGQLLLIIDQFEELFTLVPDRGVTMRFLSAMVAAVTDPRSPLRVVVTLRADFYDRPLLYHELSELVQQRTEVVIPLSTDELVRAIEGPAERVGIQVERKLVAALVADVSEQPGALPLLQYTLSELFEGREDGRLTLDGYRRLGSISGALAQRADAVYDALDDSGQSAARALFFRLVTLGEGVEDTRRHVLRSELEALDTVGAGLQPAPTGTVINHFGRARLLSFDRDPVTRGPTVEIAHEALLRAWPRLRGWLDENRAALRLSRLLTTSAAEWEAAARGDGFMLRGARLDQLAPLAAGTVALTETERSYLAASLAARQTRRAAEDARQQAEIDTAQKLAQTERERADEQARSAGRLRRRAALLAGALGLAIFLAILAAGFARSSSRNAAVAATREAEALANAQLASTREAEAHENARLAISRELSSEAVHTLPIDPELSILLALEALGTLETAETHEALHRAIQASRVINAFDTGATGHVNPIMDVSPDGERLVTAGESSLTIWDVTTGTAIEQLPLPESADVHHYVGFDSDGESVTLVSASADARSISIHSWMGRSSSSLAGKTLPIEHDAESTIVTDPSRRLLAVSHDEPALELWDITTGRRVAELGEANHFIADMEFNGTGGLLVVAEMTGRTTLWDMTTLPAGDPQSVATLESSLPEGALVHAQFVSDTQLALGYLGNVEVWDLSDLRAPQARQLPQAELTLGYAVNGDGSLLATATQDGSIQIWSLVTGERSLALAEHPAPVNVVRFIDGDRRLVSMDRAGHVRVWDARALPLGERGSLSVDPGTFDIALSPDEQLMALGNVGGPASLWDAATGERRFELSGATGAIYRVDFSPDGRAVAGVGYDNRLHVWDTATGEEILSVPAHGTGVAGRLFQGTLDVAFSPDGSRLATAGADGLAKVWDATTGELLLTFSEHTDSLHSLAYSPNGRTIATTSDESDASVKVWDAQTGRVVYTLTGHPVRVWGLAFSPDSRYLVTGGARGVIKLWDMTTGKEVYTVYDGSDHIGTVVFSPDGEWFLTTGEVPMRARRTTDGSELVELTAPIVWSAAIRRDGRSILGGDVNGMVRELVVERDDLVELAHQRLTRWWRPEECRRYLRSDVCPPAPEKFVADN